MKGIIRTSLAIALFALPIKAEGLKITFKNSSGKTEIHYHSATHSRIDYEPGKSFILIDYANSVSYSVSHEKKTISKLSFEDSEKLVAIAAAKSLEKKPPSPEIATRLGLPKKAVVKKSTEEIAGRTCEKFRISVGRIVHTLCVDASLLPSNPQDSHARQSATEALPLMFHPVMGPYFVKMNDEIAKIKGILLKHETRMPGQPKTVSTAISIKDGTPQGSLFVLPKGYDMQDAATAFNQWLDK